MFSRMEMEKIVEFCVIFRIKPVFSGLNSIWIPRDSFHTYEG